LRAPEREHREIGETREEVNREAREIGEEITGRSGRPGRR
jgi:hypothetical protein